MKLLKPWRSLFVGALLSVSLASCVAPQNPAPVTRPVAVERTPIVTPQAQREIVQAIATPVAAPPASFTQRIDDLWRGFPGKTGIAVRKIDNNGWAYAKRGDELFPQQSVSKTWVTLAILDQVDKGRLSLNKPVTIGPDDLTLFHQPIASRVTSSGSVTETIGSLMQLAITKSDNTANDVLLWQAGGPDAVNAFIRDNGLGAIRFGPGERLLQSGIAGMNWTQAMSRGRNFYIERSKVPDFIRKKALESYVADPIDGAAPLAIVDALAKLARGELLSPASTELMLSTMSRTSSGPNRLKGGVPSGWRFGHKTGTGQVHGPIATGYNDIGILTAPDGTRYALAVMLGETTASIPERMRLMNEVTRATVAAHYAQN